MFTASLRRMEIFVPGVVVASLLQASCAGGGSEVFDTQGHMTSDCEVAGNLVENCGFELDDSGWVVSATSSGHVEHGCLSGAGCIELTHEAPDPEIVYVSQCIPITINIVYRFTAHVRVVAGTLDHCELAAAPFIEGDCTGGHYGDSFVYQLFVPGDSWDQSPTLHVYTGVPPGNIGPNPQSVLISVACRGSATFTVRFDDFSLT
jgi:hypothetical protein